MNRHVKEQLDDYLMGWLDTDLRRAVERHVLECRSCAVALRQARASQSILQWLRLADAPPQPGPDFYVRLQRSIEKRQAESTSWLDGFVAALQPHLAYPLALLAVLIVAWALTLRPPGATAPIPGAGSEEGLAAVEFSSQQFPVIASTDWNSDFGPDQVMISLVGMPETQ